MVKIFRNALSVAPCEQCLAKDPKRRLRDLADVRLLLEQATEGSTGIGSAQEYDLTAAPRNLARFLWPGLAVISSIGWIATSLLRPQLDPAFQSVAEESSPVSRRVLMDVDRDSDLRLTGEIQLSPDGSMLAFSGADGSSGRTDLFLRRLDRLEARAMPLGESFTSLCFSPDGSELAIFVPEEQAIKKVPVGGGDVFRLCRTSEDKELLYGLDWGEHDQIVFATGATDGIQEVTASGGAAQPVP